MKKFKENEFAKKFCLLNSQESGAEIHWSSSESSEYETVQNNDSFNNRKSKCKRKRKLMKPKNISSLDITILQSSKDQDYVKSKRSSDLSISVKKEHHSEVVSPILGTSRYLPPYKCKESPNSPIITSKLLDKSVKSPILILKTASPIISQKVRKKLFEVKGTEDKEIYKSQGPMNSNNQITIKNKNKSVDLQVNCDNTYAVSDTLTSKHSYTEDIKKEIEESNIEINYTIQETPENLDDSIVMLKTRSIDLAKKVKSYFDSHFSSENASQQSISDIPTPKNTSKSSDDVDIISITSQSVSNRGSTDSNKLEHPSVIDDKKEKKVRYKKDGLSHRLNTLLKKQTASVSLWKHERFLAANSDFVIPKEEYTAFRISNTCFKYGCYMLDAMDCNDKCFLILINSNFVSHETIFTDSVLKLYEPYKILNLKNDCNLIINVIKYECFAMKT